MPSIGKTHGIIPEGDRVNSAKGIWFYCIVVSLARVLGSHWISSGRQARFQAVVIMKPTWPYPKNK